MEHKRKKQWILIIMLLLTVCSVFVVYAGREWMFTNPFKPYTFSSVSYASGDGDGCTYVIDDSNRKILKISADGRLLWRACASDKSFLSAERVVADGDGNVYLHDVRIEQGVQIASEGIVKLSSKGKYISTVASVEAEKGRGLGVYSLFENGAQSLGSFVFGYVLVLGVGRGLIFVLILVSVLSAAFLISTTFAAHRDKKEVKEHGKKTKTEC